MMPHQTVARFVWPSFVRLVLDTIAAAKRPSKFDHEIVVSVREQSETVEDIVMELDALAPGTVSIEVEVTSRVAADELLVTVRARAGQPRRRSFNLRLFASPENLPWLREQLGRLFD